MRPALDRLRARIATAQTRARFGRVERVLGTALEVRLGGLRLGELCRVGDGLAAEVVSVAEGRAVLTPVGEVAGLAAGMLVTPTGRGFEAPAGEALFGRVLDGLGRPIDGRGPLPPGPRVPVD
ncbi:EscN/YscN/HrcN family type III secretion system ATPase, partial [Roseomonas hellenica]|nr:EscN/YscN/HrcN family type III secretion system ATPase [Plastoroseomonas hellenica]